MNVDKEKVMDYINYETGIPMNKTLQSSLIMSCILGIPASFFGAYSNITRIILFPFVIVFSLWALFLMINTESKKDQYILFLGAFSLLTSLLFMIAAYKYALTIYRVTWVYIFSIIVLYIIANTLNIFNVIRLIKKGYYKKKGRSENPMSLFIAMSVLGMCIGKIFINANQDTVTAILVSLSLFMSFLFTTGTHNFLKYYYIKNNVQK